MSTFQDLKYKYSRLDVFGRIIVINIIIFVLAIIFSRVLKINFFDYFRLPSDATDFIVQPWSIITYGFLHFGFWHLVFNMLFLFYLSRVSTNILNIKTILNVYIMGIVFGGLAYLAVFNIIKTTFFGTPSVLNGASAGVAALLSFVAVYMKHSTVRLFNAFTVKWQHIAIFFIILDGIRLLLGLNRGGYVAHFGGYLLGYLYATRLQKGTDIGKGFERLMDTVIGYFKPKSNLKTVHRKKGKSAYAGKTKKEFSTYNKQKKIDLILDKISKSGYDSLTAEEKEFLFKAGKD